MKLAQMDPSNRALIHIEQRDLDVAELDGIQKLLCVHKYLSNIERLPDSLQILELRGTRDHRRRLPDYTPRDLQVSHLVNLRHLRLFRTTRAGLDSITTLDLDSLTIALDDKYLVRFAKQMRSLKRLYLEILGDNALDPISVPLEIFQIEGLESIRVHSLAPLDYPHLDGSMKSLRSR